MRIDDGLGPLVELAVSRHNAFHTTEAAEIGINSRRLRRAERNGILYNLHPRVWAFAPLPVSPAQAIRAATVALTGGVASHQSAAWLHGWIDAAPAIPQVWVTPGLSARVNQAQVHRLSNVSSGTDVCITNNVRCLNKAATLCVLGSVAPKSIVERCLEEFLRTESESWLDGTFARLWTPSAKGARVLAEIRDDPKRVQGVADSFLERVISGLVAQPGLPEVVLQHPVSVDGRNFRIDIACPELMLGIEVHSRTYHFGRDKEDADNVRDLLIGAAGWELIYVTYAQSKNPQEFVRQYRKLAVTRAKQLGITLPTGVN